MGSARCSYALKLTRLGEGFSMRDSVGFVAVGVLVSNALAIKSQRRFDVPDQLALDGWVLEEAWLVMGASCSTTVAQGTRWRFCRRGALHTEEIESVGKPDDGASVQCVIRAESRRFEVVGNGRTDGRRGLCGFVGGAVRG